MARELDVLPRIDRDRSHVGFGERAYAISDGAFLVRQKAIS
jgi:hypothetical protein